MSTATEEWEQKLISYYGESYNYYEKTNKELAALRRQRKWLQDHVPDKYKTGVHLIRRGCCFMGEDLVMIDGKPDHNLHCRCATCDSPTVFAREDKTWCMTCNDWCNTDWSI